MAITPEQQTQILEVAVGLFNAAPGKVYMTELANLVDPSVGNLSIEQLADLLDDTPLFKNEILLGNVTIDDQANILLKNFGLVADDDPASAGSQAKAFFVAELTEGESLGEIALDAIAYLNGTTVAPEFATTATLLDNKVLVAKAYSATGASTDLAVLQTVLSKVTGDHPYTPADVQNALDDSGVSTGSGQEFTLKVGEDNITGTSGNDTFKALVVEQSGGGTANSLESIDRLDGNTGTDTLSATLLTAAAPSLSNIENVLARFAGGVALDLANATGVQAITVNSSTAAGTVDSVGAAANLSVRNQLQNVTFNGNTATSLNLNLDTVGNFTTPTVNNIDLDTGATTLNLTTNNANAAITTLASVETLTVAASGVNEINQGSAGVIETVTVTGTGSIDFQDAFTALTTLTATDNSGGVAATMDSDAVTVNTGSGADDIHYTAALAATAAVTLGAGDDLFTIGAPSAVGSTVDAGDDNDALAISDGAWLDANAADIYSNFETLEIGDGEGIYDMDNLPGLTAITIGAALADVTDITNAAAGTTVTVNAEESTDLDLANDLTYALAAAAGTSDAVSLTLNALDGDDDGTAEGVISVPSFEADDIETFDIVSNVSEIDDELANTDYTNTIAALLGDSVGTINVSGSANLEITALTSPDLNKIDASTMTGGLTVDASTVVGGSGVEFLGGSADDDYTGTASGDTITGNGGADTIELGATAGAVDTLILNAATDSQLNADADGHDVITNFGTTAGAGPLDVIDVGAFGFTGQQASALANKGVLPASAVDGTTLSVTDFFASGGVDRGVAIGTNGGNTFVFVDVDKNGDFTAGEDAVVQLTGVTDVTLANFGF